jgi:copper transport protein
LVAILAALVIPLAASAHALLSASSPPAGAHLGTAPGVVTLEFDQPLTASLSFASVTDPTGRVWKGQVDSAEEIRIPLTTNASGVYTVDWTSVSQFDGHKVTSSFTFDVGIAGPGSSVEAANAVPGPAASDIAIGAVKWIEALALLFLVGQLLLATLAKRSPPLDWVTPGFRTSSIALSAGLVAVWAEATVGSGGHSVSGYLAFFNGLSGAALIARLCFEILTLVAVVLKSRTVPIWVAGALVMLAAGGHAAGVDPAWYGIGLDAIHLLAAGLWAGGIAALALVHPPGGWRSTEARVLLARFTPVALAAFSATVVAGGLEAITQLGSIQALFGTAYGRVLLIKMALVALMLPLSAMAWRLKRPHVRIEAALAVGVVAAAALLSSFPTPPTAAARQAAEEAAATPTAGLPTRDELTMAGAAGSILVGLSLSPGLPGVNRATVYLLPPQGSAAQGLAANIAVNGVYKALLPCGDSCRSASIDIKQGDVVDVETENAGGGEATFTIPALPAPSGAALLAQLESTMKALSAFQYSEVLTSGGRVEHSTFSADAPDRTAITINDSGRTIWIGSTFYTQEGPGQPWEQEPSVSPNDVSTSFTWNFFTPLTSAHVIGQAMLEGVPTTVVASFGDAISTPLWFTFWVDPSGRVRQVAMDAQQHFMIDTYTSYDKPVDIVAPVG